MDIGMRAIRARTSDTDLHRRAAYEYRACGAAPGFRGGGSGPFGASPRFLLASRDEIEDDAAHAKTARAASG